jgi:hypothetical protein
LDTIKLVAYRAETAMAQIVRETLPKGRQGEERRLLASLYASEADLIPDQRAGALTVRLHYPANDMLRPRRTYGYAPNCGWFIPWLGADHCERSRAEQAMIA